jgi:diacylglycerol kinase family enzyme
MKVLCIINPASGKSFPILSVLNDFFRKNSIKWEVHITETKPLLIKGYDLVIIYGGDGTITEYLAKINLPVLILPGGTGNSIAKTLNISPDPAQALKLLKKGKKKKFDAFLVNKKIKFLRVFNGNTSLKMKEVDRKEKNLKGIAAYIEAFIKGSTFKKEKFKLIIDGKKENIESNLLIISNFAYAGVGVIKIDKRIDPQDGYLDLLSINDPMHLFKNHWKFKRLTILTKKPNLWSVDDQFFKLKKLEIKILPKKFELIAPKE